MPAARDGDTDRLPSALVAAVAAACVLPFLLHLTGWRFVSHGGDGELIHSLLEWSAVCASLFTAYLGLVYLRVRADYLVLMIAISAFVSGLWDALHALASIGLMQISTELQDFVPLTWAISRTFRALCFTVGTVIILSWTPRKSRFGPGPLLVSAIAIIVIAASFLDLTLRESLPEAHFSAGLIKRPWDLPALVLFAINGLVLFPMLVRRRPSILSRALLLSAAPDIIASMTTVFGSAILYDFPFHVAHGLKLVGAVVPSIGISLFFINTFRRERRVTNRLERTVTDLTHAEDELRRSELRLNQLTENIREVFWLSSADGSEMFYVSPAYEEIFGLSCESLYANSQSYINAVHPDDREAMSRLASGGSTEDFDVEFRILKNGIDLRWLRTRGFPIRNDSGAVYRLAGVTEDITESKHAGEALKSSEARNRALIEAMPDLMFRLDRTGTILDYHARTGIPLYREPSEFLGKNLAGIFPKLGERFMDALRASLDTGTMQLVEYRLEIDDFVADYEARFVRSTEDEALTLVRDITEHKRLEKEVLDVSNREQHRIGHDLHDGISQQLTGIALLCKALQQKLAASGIPEAAQARQIEQLADDAIAQTRSLARGLAPVQLEEGGLTAALEELALGVETRHAVRCQLHPEAEIPVPSHAFATHLYRIAQEAVNNALQHGDPSSISIRFSQNNGRIRLSVADDGTGIDTSVPSDGMGVNIMRYRARMIDATLKIEPALERGTIVSCEWSPASDS